MVWLIWALTPIVSFAVLEAWAILTHHDTLSHDVWRLSQMWPPFPALLGFLAGAIVGFLLCHFWWYGAYCPPHPTPMP